MKVVHLCMQHYGGAGTSAERLHAGLVARGVDSSMLVLKKRGDAERIHLLPGPEGSGAAPVCADNGETLAPGWISASNRWNRHLSDYAPSPDLELFSDPGADTRLDSVPLLQDADVFNLHWVAGMVDFRHDVDFLASKPVVWTLHDMNAFTGGCHYSVGCDKYRRACGACHLLGSGREEDISREYFETKRRAYERLGVICVTPSKWLGECAGASALFGGFERRVIPYGLPTDVFQPFDKAAVRRELGVPEDAKVVLFGAASVHNRRKGFRYLLDALEDLAAKGAQNVVLAVFGEFGGDQPRLPFPVIPAGYVTEEAQLAFLFSMADVYVLPSVEDNLPNVVLESLACGTPVVGFDIGGIPDMVEHRSTGWLVERGDVRGLADGIRWAIADKPIGGMVRRLTRASVLERYTMDHQAAAYEELYQSLLAG